jgi:hypothetical protein
VRRELRQQLVIAAALLALASLAATLVPIAQARHHPSRCHKRHHHKVCRKVRKPTAPVGRSTPGAPLASMGALPAPSIFGIDTATYDTSTSNYASDFPTSRSLGARWDHFTAGQATGIPNYTVLDDQVTRARRQGMGVVISLAGIAAACSLNPRPANVSACPPTTAADLSSYQSYIKGLVLHYRNVVDTYESWAEPNNPTSFQPSPNPARYAAILEAQYAEFQALNSQYGLHLTLLFGSPAGFSSASGDAVLPFTEQVLNDLGGRRAFDGVALHAYRFPPSPEGPGVAVNDNVAGVPAQPGAAGPFPNQGCNSTPWCQMTWPQELSAYEQEFTNRGFGQPPLWVTEFGWPGNAQGGDAYHPSNAVQARYLQDAYGDLLQLPFVQGALWFNLRNYQPGYSTSDPEFFFHFGLLNYDFSEKPAAAQFKSLAAANPGR